MNSRDEFGGLLVRLVRDRALRACDQMLTGRMVGSQGELWGRTTEQKEVRAAVEKLLPDVVDQVLFELLKAVEDGELILAWYDSSGDLLLLRELGSGEMAGWLTMGSGGWIDRFSSERFNEYYGGLELDLGDGEHYR